MSKVNVYSKWNMLNLLHQRITRAQNMFFQNFKSKNAFLRNKRDSSDYMHVYYTAEKLTWEGWSLSLCARAGYVVDEPSWTTVGHTACYPSFAVTKPLSEPAIHEQNFVSEGFTLISFINVLNYPKYNSEYCKQF